MGQTLRGSGSFDVVEHIEDDLKFLREVCFLLMDGGRVYITVPAYAWFWSRDDELAGHYRRFTVRSLRDLLKAAGFRVEFATYFFAFLPLPIFLLRALPSRLGFGRQQYQQLAEVSRDHAPIGKVGSIIDALLAPEKRRIKN